MNSSSSTSYIHIHIYVYAHTYAHTHISQMIFSCSLRFVFSRSPHFFSDKISCLWHYAKTTLQVTQEIVYAPRVAMHHPNGCPELRPCLCHAFPSLSTSFFHRKKSAGRYYSTQPCAACNPLPSLILSSRS